MFFKNLSIALRKLQKQRDFAVLNVLGLSLSIGSCLLIFLFLHHHLSFERQHKKADRIARVLMDVKTDQVMPFAGAPMPMTKTLREEYPGIEYCASSLNEGAALISIEKPDGQKVKFKEIEDVLVWTESSYFKIMDLPLLLGKTSSLNEPGTVLISEKMAEKYFGRQDPMGQIIRYNNEIDLRVSGILKNLPAHTDYPYEIYASFETLRNLPGQREAMNSWAGARGGHHCFVLLKPAYSLEQLNKRLVEMRKTHPHPQAPELFQYKAKSLLSLHFDPDYGFGMNKSYLWALGMIALFLLLTACVNFVNMATALASTRVREVGVRKSLGSTKGQLFWQFMGETGIIVATAMILGFVLAQLGLPILNKWLSEDLSFGNGLWLKLLLFSLLLGFGLTFLAGFYPGWIQARFNPVLAMKGATNEVAGGFALRRMLVTSQFIISQVLIIGAAVVTAQMSYASKADWGYRPGTIVNLSIPENDKAKPLKSELQKISGLLNISLCYESPASGNNNFSGIRFANRPKGENWLVSRKEADTEYLETFGLKLVAGRNIMPSDTVREYLVNEAMARRLNIPKVEDLIGQKISLDDLEAPIVGVVRDFINLGLGEEIMPIGIASNSKAYQTCAVRLAQGDPKSTLAQIRQVWEKQFPNYYFEMKLVDESIQEFMETETMILRLVRTFAGIAIFIGCLGLYGLAAFMVNRKRKEVGIRKTLGSSIGGILWLFGKEYSRLVLIAFAVAAPCAWWVMSNWLEDYQYRIKIGWGIFLLSLGASAMIALLTVGYQSIKAALANPVKALKSE
jgi:putative ABC transport system permease protein